MGRLALSLLGPMWVTRDSHAVAGFEYDKVRALLAYLALEAGRPHRREALAGLLWPEQPEKSARDSLRNALATLRRVIGDAEADPPYLFITREAVRFNADSDHTLDVAEVRRRLEYAGRHRHRNPETCRICAAWRREAADLYHGPLLAQFSLPDSPEFDHWLLNEREQLHQVVMDAFQHLAGYYLLRGDYDAARFFAGRQLAHEPWHEEAHRQVMLALAHKGDRSAALAQYQACVRALDEELGVKPEAETVLLFERIRDGTLLRERPGRALAAPATPLIGRERDLMLLNHQLTDPDVRLITIVGPGGVGKTSLAREAGRQFGPDFSGGAIFVPLAAAIEPSDILPAIAASLGLRLEPTSPPLAQVGGHLRSREILLILDNFEHLATGAGRLLDLMAAAPRLVLLVTSRQRLNLSIEWLHELQGLDFPAENSTHPLAEFTALQLFARRVGQQRRDFALVSSEALAAADICRLVQGMPLAIELAAAAAGTRSMAEIARQLHAGLDALAVDWADLPPRHRSLQALIDWSYDLLSPFEQRLLRRLSVFAGEFTLEAAEAICDLEGEGNTLESLTQLVHKSLVVAERTPGQATRYDLHETIRQYAWAKLEKDEGTGRIRELHAGHYRRMALNLEHGFEGRDLVTAGQMLDSDMGNLRAAMQWMRATENWMGLAQLSAALGMFWMIRGHIEEGQEWLALVLEHRPIISTRLLGNVLKARGHLYFESGKYVEAQAQYHESLAIYRALDDIARIADLLGYLGHTAQMMGEFSEAEAHYLESLEAFRQLGDNSGVAWILNRLGHIAYYQGDLERADRLLKECLDIRKVEGDIRGEASTLNALGENARARGDFSAALRFYEQAFELCRQLEDKRCQAGISHNLAHTAYHLGDLAMAERNFHTSIIQYYDLNNAGGCALCLMGLVGVVLDSGDPHKAAILMGTIETIISMSKLILGSADQKAWDRAVERTKQQLITTRFHNALDKGRSMSLEEAIAYALEEQA